MTQRPYPDPVHSTTPPSTDDPAPVVRSVGDLLAAVPALLGFVPERSLVLICFSTGTRTVVEVCMRQDLPDRLDHPVLGDVVDRCAEVCDREGFDAVLAVLVTGTRFAMPYEVVADLLRTTLQRWDIELMGVHHVRHLVAGETWRSLGGDPRRGTLPDPIASSVAASTVASGRQIRSSREDIALLLMPVAPSECAHFEDSRRHVDLEDGPLTDTELLSDTVDDLAFVHATGEIDHLVAARIMRAVAVISVRDAMLGLATTDLAPTAEMVWVELTRRVTGPDRAHPATLLAVWSYLRGDGPLASVALETALVADPHYRLAHLLDTALQNGLRPTIVRDLVTSARALAADLGVDLPPDA